MLNPAYRLWKNLSITRKLNFVIGAMAFLIVGELFTLRFALSSLSAVRALVGGESHWSKAHKDAVFNIGRYSLTHKEEDFHKFLETFEISEGDTKARLEFAKPHPNYEIIKIGLIQGRLHPDDIPAIYQLIKHFSKNKYLAHAITAWEKGDKLLEELKTQGIQFHNQTIAKHEKEALVALERVISLNLELTNIEIEFSESLEEGSRWLESLLLFFLTFAVLTVESIGLSLAFFTNRSITRRLIELQESTQELANKKFSTRISVDSSDEIGMLAKTVNEMGRALETSYRNLEEKVQERTAEARLAVQMRDEFLSIASHELRTPLTSLSLSLQLLSRKVERMQNSPEQTEAHKLSEMSQRTVTRLILLLEELLDLTRIQVGKFQLKLVHTDIIPIIYDSVTKFAFEASHHGAAISIDTPTRLMAQVDPVRFEQVLSNLISNAIKYGNGSSIKLTATQDGNKLKVSVHDKGPGIPIEKQTRLFDRFERTQTDPNINGLGLGLYISKQIILAHGGQIDLVSKPNEGTVFTVTLDTNHQNT